MAFGQCSEAIQILSRGNPNPRRSRVENFLKKGDLSNVSFFRSERFVFRGANISFCGLYFVASIIEGYLRFLELMWQNYNQRLPYIYPKRCRLGQDMPLVALHQAVG